MATFTAKILAQGQLPNAKGTLYTAPVLTKAYVKFINAFNTGGGTEVVIFYVKLSTGTSKIICRASLATLEQQRVIEKDETINLGPGDTIEGQTTTAATVDYTITGVEESP
jgi:NaMN:DMB phosphoribosyltransferase